MSIKKIFVPVFQDGLPPCTRLVIHSGRGAFTYLVQVEAHVLHPLDLIRICNFESLTVLNKTSWQVA